MGRNYYCEYCEKSMKNDLNIRKHLQGLHHKIAKSEYLQRFKDPQQILHEESQKRPCERFLKGKECRFGFFCRFSHYTEEQLNEIKEIIEFSLKKHTQQKNENVWAFQTNDNYNKKSTAMTHHDYKNNNVSENQLWNYSLWDETIQMDRCIPPSLQRISLEKISKLKQSPEQWGG